MYKYMDQEILLALETLGQEFPEPELGFSPCPRLRQRRIGLLLAGGIVGRSDGKRI